MPCGPGDRPVRTISRSSRRCATFSAAGPPESLDVEGVKHTLDAGRRALREFRCCVFTAMVVFACCCMAGSWALEFIYGQSPGHASWAACAFHFVEGWLVGAGNVFLGLAPLPDDLVRTRIVLMAFLVSLGVFCSVKSWGLLRASSDPDWCWADIADVHCVPLTNIGLWSLNLVNDAALFCVMCLALARKKAETMQSLMWSGVGINAGVNICRFAVLAALSCATHIGPAPLFRLPGTAFCMYIAVREPFRHRVHGTLRRHLQVRRKRKAATGVAALLGSSSMAEILDKARARFRCIDLSLIVEADVAHNHPDPALFSKSTSTSLGTCDAFITHSWHDDPRAKWEALQDWRAKFVAENGREPKVWIDKCCLDQTNIDLDLRCLPIFISGCNRMVVLFGSSYLSRLWCVIELFTFVQMGLDIGLIDLLPVCRSGSDHAGDKAELVRMLQRFDVSQCSCFNYADKEKMQNVIYAAFGDLRNFSQEVSRTLQAAELLESA